MSTPHLPVLSFDYQRAARNSKGLLGQFSPDEVEAIAQRYRQYLWLKSQYPEQPFAPTEIIDEMWHLHMLHPRAYYRDCMALFGFILDHKPGFGGDEATRPTLLKHFNRTAALWERTFGTPYSPPGQAYHGVIICADEDDEEDKPMPKPTPKPKPEDHLASSMA